MLRRKDRQLISGVDIVEVDPPEIEEPKPRPPRPIPPKPSPPKPRPPKRASLLPFRSLVVPDGANKIQAFISSDHDFPEVLLALRVDENTDLTCDRIWPDEEVIISSITIVPSDGTSTVPSYEVSPGGQVVKIQGVKAKVDYNVCIEYNVPPKLMSTVEMPVFRLELYRPHRIPKQKAPETERNCKMQTEISIRASDPNSSSRAFAWPVLEAGNGSYPNGI